MIIKGSKIEKLAEYYANERGVTKNTYHFFCLEEKLGYTKWNTYKKQDTAGWTAMKELNRIFPNLNMNWLLKDKGSIFLEGEIIPDDFSSIKSEILDKLESLEAFYNEAKGDE